MNPSIRRFTLDTNATRSQISIPVTLNDTGRIWHITLTEGGLCYRIEDGCLAVLSVKRPNGSYFEDVCPVLKNVTIVYDFSQNEKTAAVEGIHDCEVTIFGANNTILTSATFTMVVGTRAVTSDDITITDDDRTIIDYCACEEVKRQTAEAERVEVEAARVSSENERNTEEEKRAKAEAEREAFWGNKAAVYLGSGEMPEGYNVQIDTEGTSSNEFDESKLPTEIYYKVIEPEWVSIVKGQSYEISGIQFSEEGTEESASCAFGADTAYIDVPQNTYYTTFSHSLNYSTGEYDRELPSIVGDTYSPKVFLDDNGKKIIVSSNKMAGAGCPEGEVHLHLTTYKYEDGSPVPQSIVLYKFSEVYDFENLQFTTVPEGNTKLGDVFTYVDEWGNRSYTLYPDYTPNIKEGTTAISLAVSDDVEDMLYSIKLEALFNGGYKYSLGNKDFSFLGGQDVVANGNGAFSSGKETFVTGDGANGIGTKNFIRSHTATAFGLNNIVTALHAIAFNEGNKVLGYGSLGFGDHNGLYGRYDFGGGWNNKLFGAVVFGYGSENYLKGEHLTGFGHNNTIEGMYTLGHGLSNVIKGNYNLFNGYKNTVNGNNNTINGMTNVIDSSYNTVFGTNNSIIATSDYNIINGNNNKITKDKSFRSIISGDGNIIESGGYSVVVGLNNLIKSRLGCALGEGLIVDSGYGNQLVVGRYNEVDRWARFVVGNGTSDTNRSNAVVVRNDGTIIQKSPNGTKYAISVNDDGTIKTKKVTY